MRGRSGPVRLQDSVQAWACTRAELLCTLRLCRTCSCSTARPVCWERAGMHSGVQAEPGLALFGGAAAAALPLLVAPSTVHAACSLMTAGVCRTWGLRLRDCVLCKMSQQPMLPAPGVPAVCSLRHLIVCMLPHCAHGSTAAVCWRPRSSRMGMRDMSSAVLRPADLRRHGGQRARAAA